ncbi:hypothetical protein [Archaeoglobus sp.]
MIELPSNIWYGDEPLRFEPPENWDVTVFRMSGDTTPLNRQRRNTEEIERSDCIKTAIEAC